MPTLEGTYRKITGKIMPFLIVCYVFATLDRINIGFAKLEMQHDIALGELAYGIGAGIFFLGYVLFEVPSNLLLVKIGARRTLGRIMILWGLTSAATFLVRTPVEFYIVRFLLGVFEAGFAPGVLYYLTRWYPDHRRGRVLGLFLIASPISSVIGGPLSGAIMSGFSGFFGLHGWQWLFIVEGVPCVFLGIYAFKRLIEHPGEASWLSSQEKALLAADYPQAKETVPHSFKHILTDYRVYVMAIAYFCLIFGLYTIMFWLPTMLATMGWESLWKIGLLSSMPHAAAILAMIGLTRSSDHFQERRFHSALAAFGAAVALLGSVAAAASTVISLALLTLATGLMFGAYAVFWAIPTAYFRGAAAAGGIAFVNSIGLFGGLASPALIGWSKEVTGKLTLGILLTALILTIGGTIILLNFTRRRPS